LEARQGQAQDMDGMVIAELIHIQLGLLGRLQHQRRHGIMPKPQAIELLDNANRQASLALFGALLLLQRLQNQLPWDDLVQHFQRHLLSDLAFRVDVTYCLHHQEASFDEMVLRKLILSSLGLLWFLFDCHWVVR
jgi:hypothetical protein